MRKSAKLAGPRIGQALAALLIMLAGGCAASGLRNSDQTVAGAGVIAFPGRDAEGAQNIFFIEPDGHNQRQMTRGHDNAMPSWSPSGAMLAYESRNPQDGVSSIRIMNADGSGSHPVTVGASPMWSPDGRQIAYAGPSAARKATEIWTMRPDGSSKRQLTDNLGIYNGHPTWSPDGTRLAFVRVMLDKTGTPHPSIWIMSSDGSDQRQLTTGVSDNRDRDGKVISTANDANSPSWSPSNKIVFWSGIERDVGQIWSINPDGTGRTQLTHAVNSHNDDPEWSPDGTKIIFNSDRDGDAPGLWVMNADGSGQVKIVNVAIGPLPGDPSWQPRPLH